MAMKFYHPLLVCLLLLANCNTTLTGYRFKILAIYRAPRSNLQITVNAQGHVPAGSDISETYQGAVLIEPVSHSGENVELRFADDNEQVTYTIDSGGPAVAEWGFRDSENSLISILAKSGYEKVDADEVSEIVRVIGGALAGPKAVILEGQSKHLEVVKVNSNG